MLLQQFSLSNNLLTHIRENTDFPSAKASATAECQANFEDCNNFRSMQNILMKKK